jgi:hypothetical protein
MINLGVVYPEDGELTKSKGRRVGTFGPVKDWKIMYSGSCTAVSEGMYEIFGSKYVAM